jgi:hypothetical protein
MSALNDSALPAPAPQGYALWMTIAEKSPAAGSIPPARGESADSPAAFTLEAIGAVRDFTARRLLEQAHALVTAIARLEGDAEPDDEDRALLRDLESAGITARDAGELATEALALIALIADRDRKADVFHEAVKQASRGERAVNERLASITRVLRARLGDRSPALAKLGVPPDSTSPPKHPARAIFSAAVE